MYRVKQFFQGLFAKVNNEDKDFIKRYLNEEENLFFQLRISEQYHSLKVAYGCLQSQPENRMLIRAALLHDIGKIGSNLHLINKSLVVLIKKFKIDKGKLPSFLKKAIYYKEEHPEIGYKLLLSYSVDEPILELVKNHHVFNENYGEEMKTLKHYDNKF